MIRKSLFVLLAFFGVQATDYQKEFIKSFVMHYDFSPEGRYTHEYHPFLLKQTRDAMKGLETFLVDQKFDVQGRIIIMGYQQEGVPSYYSNLNAQVIDDEVSLKTRKGRVVPAHNIFGFLTGFLLKDCNWLQRKWYGDKPLLIEHMQPERVDLFDDKAFLFQKHAFGNDFDGILGGRDYIEKSLKQQNIKETLSRLITFWERAYKGELKSCGQEVLATQDILFSVDYAKHLTETSIPLTKMYVGPDITYPIEVMPFQEQGVTESAQNFVQQFTPTLTARDGKKTAYIFCSFVDGVGKSTLLGNVINFAKHGTHIADYERVDNSSSQSGTLYQLRKDTYIMDLPAQLSHWVSKPDGYVFVAVETVKEFTANNCANLCSFVAQEKDSLIDAFDKRLQEAHIGTSFYDVYVKNVKLFSPENRWIPFEKDSRTFVFNQDNPSKIKVLVPLDGVHSRGLKTVQPEQMLFTKGLLLPMHYNAFMNDVAQQFKKAGIEKLVFVDFLSMYPRSSRENVRINFLMQQLRTLFPKDFTVNHSLYRSFVNRGPEMYHLLSQARDKFSKSLLLETVLRTGLYQIFKEKNANTIVSLDENEVTQALKSEIQSVFSKNNTLLASIVAKKVEQECNALRKYSRDKNYEIFVRFNFEPLVAFSRFMQDLFSTSVGNSYLSGLWTNTRDAHAMQTIAQFDSACRDSVQLSGWFVSLRAQWYAMLCNLVYAQGFQNGIFTIEKAEYEGVPTLVEQKDKMIFINQKSLPAPEDKPRWITPTLQRFHNYCSAKNVEWGLFQNVLHCLEWQASETYWGIYAFGCSYNPNSYLRKKLQAHQEDAKAEGFDNVALSSSEVCNLVEQDNMWHMIAQAEGRRQTKKVKPGSGQWHALRLWARAIATLEMIIKDPQAWIVTRKNNKKDFAATLQLLERVTLPKYFGVQLDKPLFEDYSQVDPVIDWELLQ